MKTLFGLLSILSFLLGFALVGLVIGGKLSSSEATAPTLFLFAAGVALFVVHLVVRPRNQIDTGL